MHEHFSRCFALYWKCMCVLHILKKQQTAWKYCLVGPCAVHVPRRYPSRRTRERWLLCCALSFLDTLVIGRCDESHWPQAWPGAGDPGMSLGTENSFREVCKTLSVCHSRLYDYEPLLCGLCGAWLMNKWPVDSCKAPSLRGPTFDLTLCYCRIEILHTFWTSNLMRSFCCRPWKLYSQS